LIPELQVARIQRTWRFLRWRAALLIAVFVVGLTAFAAGVDVSDREGVAGSPLVTQAYYALGLFVLGGLDLGVPVGGPDWARLALWGAYFAAPAITASAVVEGILRAIGPRSWAIRRLRNHVVIAGAGRLSLQYLARLRALEPRRPVVMVEARVDQSRMNEARDLYGAIILGGDVNSDALLSALRLEYARRVVLLTGNDFVNLDTAAKILAAAPSLRGRIVAHVADLHFLRVVATTEVAKAVQIFNTHQIAAEYLVRSRLLAQFQRTEPLDTVVIAGFGRFGQTVLDELQHRAVGKFDRVILVDLDCRRKARLFDEEVGFAEGYRREAVDGDLRDPELWRRSEASFGAEPVIVVGSGDDGTNLHAALWLKARYPKAYVVARSFRRSAFAVELSQAAGFDVFSVAELVEESFPEIWFE
jgi:voltage-gated potassium channel Kch